MSDCNGRFCVNCKFKDGIYCLSPKVKMVMNCVTGHPQPKYKCCETHRMDPWIISIIAKTCGKPGRFYEAKETDNE